jgi:hypothetical protein
VAERQAVLTLEIGVQARHDAAEHAQQAAPRLAVGGRKAAPQLQVARRRRHGSIGPFVCMCKQA